MSVFDESGEEMLTLTEVSVELGLSASTLRVQITRGVIPTVKMGPRHNLIRRSDVEVYRKEHKGKPPGRKAT